MDPKTGRFLSEDHISDGLNWFGYAGNNPVNFIDPKGLGINSAQDVIDLGLYTGNGSTWADQYHEQTNPTGWNVDRKDDSLHIKFAGKVNDDAIDIHNLANEIVGGEATDQQVKKIENALRRNGLLNDAKGGGVHILWHYSS